MYEQRNCQKVAYVCDLKACGDTCPNDMCHHTFDILHAVNFECLDPDSDEKLYFEKENTNMIKDSGERTEFETGAVRDLREGKGRCDLMPLDIVAKCFSNINERVYCVIHLLDLFKKEHSVSYLYDILVNINCFANEEELASMFLDVSIHFEEGAKKYGENNWQK